jgi:hypothetical protein
MATKVGNCISTPNFLLLAKDSEHRNRSPSKPFLNRLHPDGNHVVAKQFLHNEIAHSEWNEDEQTIQDRLEIEWRVQWMCFMKDGSMETIFMDNDFQLFREMIQPIFKEEVIYTKQGE